MSWIYIARWFLADAYFEKAVIHAMCYKFKTGLFSHGWYAKVVAHINEKEYPLGFIASKYQSSLWVKLHSIIGSEGIFYPTIKYARDAME